MRRREAWVGQKEGEEDQFWDKQSISDNQRERCCTMGGGDLLLCIFDCLPTQLSCLPIDWWSVDYLFSFVYFEGILYLSIMLKLTVLFESWVKRWLLTHCKIYVCICFCMMRCHRNHFASDFFIDPLMLDLLYSCSSHIWQSLILVNLFSLCLSLMIIKSNVHHI